MAQHPNSLANLTKGSVPFAKGNKLGTGGLPKQVRLARNLAARNSPEAIETLIQWMRSTDHKASIPACLALLERGLGKPGAMREIYPAGAPGASNAPAVDLTALSDGQLDRIDAILRETAS